MFEETLIKINFFKVCNWLKQGKKKNTKGSLECVKTSEPEFKRKPFVDHSSGRDAFPGQVETSNEGTKQMFYKHLIITVLQENL